MSKRMRKNRPSPLPALMSQKGPGATEAAEPKKDRIINSDSIKFVPYDPVNTGSSMANFSDVAYGAKQDYSAAPLNVPPGFATQVPYNQAINSTIIQNPITVPMADFWKMTCADPVVYSSMLQRITKITNSIGPYINKKKKWQKHIRFCLEQVGELKLKQALATSIIFGLSGIKINWVNKDGKTYPDKILHLPPDSLMLAVTPEGELDPVIGMLHYYYNNASGWQQNAKAYSDDGNAPFASYVTYMTPQRQVAFNPMFLASVPEDWRIMHTFNPIGLAGNHWGTSLLLPIYSTLVNKFLMMKKIQIAASYKSSPLVMLLTDTGTKVQHPPNSGQFMSMAQYLAQQSPQALRSGMWIIEGMNSVEHKIIDNTADLDKMAKLIELYNNEIRYGLCTADMGGSNSFANAKVNVDMQKEIDTNITKQFIQTMIDQFVKKCLKFQFGEEIDDCGYFEIIDNTLNDQLLYGKVAEMASNLGVIDHTKIEDVNFIRKKLGLEQLDKLSDDMIMNSLMAMGKVNVADGKSQTNEPYANGLDSQERKFS